MLVVYAIAAAVILFAMSSLFYLDTVDTEGGIVLFVGAPFLGAAAAFCYGAYAWMKYGEWRSFNTAQALLELGVSFDTFAKSSGWVGVDKVALWLIELNVGWVFLAIGFLMFFSAAHWSEEGSKDRLAKQMKAHRERNDDP